MQPMEYVPYKKPEEQKQHVHVPIMPALSTAMACASGAALIASGAGPIIGVVSGVAGAAVGFTIRYLEEKKK